MFLKSAEALPRAVHVPQTQIAAMIIPVFLIQVFILVLIMIAIWGNQDVLVVNYTIALLHLEGVWLSKY